MSLRETIKEMKELLTHITTDLDKAEGGNKAASQRVRTGTVQLEKIAKKYRKESIDSEKQPRSTKKSAAGNSAKKPAAKAAKPTKAPVKIAAATAASAKLKAKPKAAVAKARPRPLAVKRPTAKLPTRSAATR
jgi:hypothetical protein